MVDAITPRIFHWIPSSAKHRTTCSQIAAIKTSDTLVHKQAMITPLPPAAIDGTAVMHHPLRTYLIPNTSCETSSSCDSLSFPLTLVMTS